MYLKHKVFVYGTLKRGCSNHGLLHGARFLGPGRTVRAHALYEDEYPLVVRDEPVSPIRGEVYVVGPAQLLALDELEGHPEDYRRERVDVVLDSGDALNAWMYFFPRPQGRRIDSGIWTMPAK